MSLENLADKIHEEFKANKSKTKLKFWSVKTVWPCCEALEGEQVFVIIGAIIQFLDVGRFFISSLALLHFSWKNIQFIIFHFRLSNLSSFQRFWLTKADYQENGPVMVHDNSKIFEDIKNSNTELSTAWSHFWACKLESLTKSWRLEKINKYYSP